MNFISFPNLNWALTCLLFYSDFADTQHIMTHWFGHQNCQSFSSFQVGNVLSVPSRTKCAIMCIQTDNCEFFRFSPGDFGAFWCELASNTLPSSINSTATSNSTSQGVHCHKRIPETSTTSQSVNQSKNGTGGSSDNSTDQLIECEISNNWFPYCYEDHSSDLHQSGWMKFIDSNIPKTQTNFYIRKRKNFKVARMVFYDDITDIIHALPTTVRQISTASFVYAMEKDEHGFSVNSSRIAYTGSWEGKLFTNFIHPNRTWWLTKTHVSHMHIYVDEPFEYSIDFDENTDVKDFVVYIEKGYKALPYQFTYLTPVGPIVLLHDFNDKISLNKNGRPDTPIKYQNRVRSIPGKLQKCFNFIGISGQMENCTWQMVHSVVISPLWKSLSQNNLDKQKQFAVVSRHMFHGHKFRVAFEDGHFDVVDIIDSEEDIYFVLPQNYKSQALTYFSDDAVGYRAAVSSNGFLSWCSHPFEGENALDIGSRSGINVTHFVDKKTWSATLSVFSNGTVAFGSAQDVADGVKGGRDVNVLIEWLYEDMKRQFTTTMLTIKGFGTHNVLVSAESGVSWSLVRQPDGKMMINGDCNMEKVLVRSDGQVQVLVYNVHYRRPVRREQDTRITWFLY